MPQPCRIEELSLDWIAGDAPRFADLLAWHGSCGGRTAEGALGFRLLLDDLQIFEPRLGRWLHCGRRTTTADFYGKAFALDVVGRRFLPAEPAPGALSGLYAEVDSSGRPAAQRVTAALTPPGGLARIVAYDRLVVPLDLSFGRAVGVATRYAPRRD